MASHILAPSAKAGAANCVFYVLGDVRLRAVYPCYNLFAPLGPIFCFEEGWLPMSTIMMPKIQQLTAKNARPAMKSPDTKVLLPRNSSIYACCNQSPWLEVSIGCLAEGKESI